MVVVCEGSGEEGDDGDALAGVGLDGGGDGGRISTGICRSLFGAASGWGGVAGAAGVVVRAVVVGNALVCTAGPLAAVLGAAGVTGVDSCGKRSVPDRA